MTRLDQAGGIYLRHIAFPKVFQDASNDWDIWDMQGAWLMRSHEVDLTFRSACQVVVRFKKQYGIPWLRFEQLSSRPGFPILGLDRKRWKKVVCTQAVTAGDDMVGRTLELCDAIEQHPEALLDTLDVAHRRRVPALAIGDAAPFARSPTHASDAESSGIVQPDQLCAMARNLSGQAMHAMAFDMLASGYKHYAKIDPDAALTIFETLVYAGYRYVRPRRFFSALGEAALSLDSVAPRANPELRLRCAAQLACALSEHGGRNAAAELFDGERLKQLTDPDHKSFWYQPQLIRSRSIYLWKHGGRPDESVRYITNANDWRTFGNLRAIATVQCLAFAKMRDFGNAWQRIEPFYREDRKLLSATAQAGQIAHGDMAHVFSGVLRGALARELTGEKYSDDDREEDLHALRWCIRQYGVIEHEILPFLPSHLRQKDADRMSLGLVEVAERCKTVDYTRPDQDALQTALASLSH